MVTLFWWRNAGITGERSPHWSGDGQVGAATAGLGVATTAVGVAESSRDEALFTALGVALGVVVVAMTFIIVVCAWRQRQQRRHLGILTTTTTISCCCFCCFICSSASSPRTLSVINQVFRVFQVFSISYVNELKDDRNQLLLTARTMLSCSLFYSKTGFWPSYSQISTDLDNFAHTCCRTEYTLEGRLRPRSARGRLQAKPKQL